MEIEVLDPVPRRGGRPKGYSPKKAREALESGAASGNDASDGYVEYSKARARNEAAKADHAELDFKIKSGQYVSRVAVRQAAATAFATVAQSMRSIPDNLERTLGLNPEVAAAIGASIDATLADLSETLEMMSGPDE
jgi:phage terminase Nu1 subunit (DNA packaging protein)